MIDDVAKAIERSWSWFSVAAVEQRDVLIFFGLVLVAAALAWVCYGMVRSMSRRTQRTDDAQSGLADQGLDATQRSLRLMEREVSSLRDQVREQNRYHAEQLRRDQERHEAFAESLHREIESLREELKRCRFQLEQSLRREAAFTSAMAFLRTYLPPELADSMQDPLSMGVTPAQDMTSQQTN